MSEVALDLKTKEFIDRYKREPIPGDKATLTSDYGYRFSYSYIVCPICGLARWTTSCNTRRPNFTGRCPGCQLAFARENYDQRKEKANNWHGGKSHRVGGYVLVRIERDSPFFSMAKRTKDKKGRLKSWAYIPEHRLVMARHLDRCLERWELVHHLNGIKDDNRYENLKLTTRREHFIEDRELELGVLERIKNLEARIIQLEAENILLRNRREIDKEV